ncbi:MAG: metalloendopeptidase [Deltaproteobacteria bacterium]|nr:MAG: metalloendopeptidase [Deltaproteobacteria bacterium]
MEKKFTLLVLDAHGTPVKRAAIPRLRVPMAALLVMAATIALFAGICDYTHLKNEAQKVDHLQAELSLKAERVASQERQLIAFSCKINELKTELNNLHRFEHKIRIIANLDPGKGESNVFGVGGSSPEDLDPTQMMAQDYQDLARDMHADIDEIDHAAYNQQNAFSSLLDQLQSKRNLLAATPSIRPVKGWISSRFGYRRSPFTGRRGLHRGIDIAARAGTPIIAPADGIVTYSGRKGLMGNMATIDHGFGMITRYGHLKKCLKKKGERVKRGETLALVGNTGRSTGPHLHYEVHLNGVPVNPEKYFFK